MIVPADLPLITPQEIDEIIEKHETTTSPKVSLIPDNEKKGTNCLICSPPNIIDYCLLILGSSVGCRFANKTFNDIGKNALHSFVATFLLVLLGVGAAFAAGFVIDKNFFTLLLSYCPGGIYEVAVIAIYFNLDPEFVSFHHIIRLLIILFVVPIFVRNLK